MERNPVVGDSGFVVALLNQRDTWHSEVAQVYAQQQQILLPQTVLTEVAYLIGRDAGVATVVAFLRGLPESRFRLVELTESDVVWLKFSMFMQIVELTLSMQRLWLLLNAMVVPRY